MIEPNLWYHFKEFNANPKGEKTNDSEVRALALAFDMTWYDVYDELSAIGRDLAVFGDVKAVVKSFLAKRNVEVAKTSRHVWPDVAAYANMHPDGRYILFVGKGARDYGLTVMINGCIYDTEDCTHRVIRKAWKVGE